MAQTQSPTNKLYAAVSTWLQAGATGDQPNFIALEKGSMATFDATTNAPASEATEAGLTRAAATVTLQTTTTTNDTARSVKTFTCGGTATTVTGFEIMSTSTAGNCLGWCYFAAGIPLASGDTLACTMDIQSKLGT